MTQAAPTITARDAQRSVRPFVTQHNAACYQKIRTSVRDGQLAIALAGRGAAWFTCTNLAQVGAFADAVADREITGAHRDVAARTYGTDAENAAYEFAAAQLVG